MIESATEMKASFAGEERMTYTKNLRTLFESSVNFYVIARLEQRGYSSRFLLKESTLLISILKMSSPDLKFTFNF